MRSTICPNCSGELEKGSCRIRKNVAAWLSWPFKSEWLSFQSDNPRGEPVKVIESQKDYTAWRCQGCGATLVLPQEINR